MIQQFAIRPVGGGGGGITAVNFSVGTTSQNLSNVVFSNSNNVTFGLNGSTITASASFATVQGSINLSAGTTSTNASAFTFSNSNGVSFGLGTGANAGIVTATVGTNYAGTVFATTTSAGTAIAGTLNTSGLTLGVPAFLTTAALSQDSSKYAGTNFATTTSAGTAIAGTLNTSGLTLGVPPFLTTAMQSNAATISNINVSAGTTSTNASAFTFSNSNGLSFGLGTGASAGVITASYTVPTVTNSSLTLSDAATSLTIARLAFTNSNGLTLTLSTAAGGSATLIGSYTVPTVTNSSWTVSDNATSGTVARLAFTNLNGVTLSLSSGTGGSHTIVGSVATSLTNINISAGTTSTNASAFTFSNSNQVSFGLGTGASAGVITASIGPVVSYYRNMDYVQATANPILVGGSTSYVFQIHVPNYLSASYMRMIGTMNIPSVSFATTANTTLSASLLSTFFALAYSLGTGASSLSLQSVASGSVGLSQQWSWAAGAVGSNWSITEKITYPALGDTSTFSTANSTTLTNLSILSAADLTVFNGGRYLDIPFANSLSPGPYWILIGVSSTTSTQAVTAGAANGITFSTWNQNQPNMAISGLPGAATNVSNAFQFGVGSFTTNAIGTTASINISNMSRSANQPIIYIQLIRGIV